MTAVLYYSHRVVCGVLLAATLLVGLPGSPGACCPLTRDPAYTAHDPCCAGTTCVIAHDPCPLASPWQEALTARRSPHEPTRFAAPLAVSDQQVALFPHPSPGFLLNPGRFVGIPPQAYAFPLRL